MYIHPWLLGVVLILIGLGVTCEGYQKERRIPGLGLMFVVMGVLAFVGYPIIASIRALRFGG